MGARRRRRLARLGTRRPRPIYADSGPDRLDPKLEAKILAKTHEPPPAPFTHWTTRRMAQAMGNVSHEAVHRVWQRAGLKPHRLERYVTSDDPDFETKAADVIGLYLTPPANAVVFSVDEKSHIQALDRLDPVLPLYAALDVGTGRVEGMTAARHTSATFVRFLEQLVGATPKRKAIHIIADNRHDLNDRPTSRWQVGHLRVRQVRQAPRVRPARPAQRSAELDHGP